MANPTLGQASPVAPIGGKPSGRRRFARGIRVFLKNPSALFGGGILVCIIVTAVLAPVLFPGDPMTMMTDPLLWPGADSAYPLGTDPLGANTLAQIVWGARVTLLVAVCATLVSLMVGLVVGSLAGYFGGRTDTILSRIVELFQTPPTFLLLITIVAVAGPSLVSIVLAIGIVTWPSMARLVRAEFRSLREKEFVMAAKSLGFSHTRIVFLEILPNAMPSIIVTTSLTVATAILMESALSFMGLGDSNIVTWGSMIGAGREYLRTAWFLSAVPGVAILFTVLSLNLLGDALTDALNPRFQQDQ